MRVQAFFRMEGRLPLPSNSQEAKLTAFEALIGKTLADGRVRLIVGLNVAFEPEGEIPSGLSRNLQHYYISQAQNRVTDRLRAFRAKVIHDFEFVPYMVVLVDADGLEDLVLNSDVLSIQEDLPQPPAFRGSGQLSGEDAVRREGSSGSGQVIVILDTGVESTHDALDGKVIDEACFSATTEAGDRSTSFCPDSADQQIGLGTGINCPADVSGCKHGTQAAGVAAGNGAAFSGVAQDAEIIAVQVFSKFTGSVCSNYGMLSPCALSWISDQIAALDWIFSIHTDYPIAAVNLSLGDGQHFSACDEDARKASIDNLRSVGIVTIVAAGDDGYREAIAAPACISSAVSVGATTGNDTFAASSNASSFLSLLAPGESISVPLPNDEYETMAGTSVAASYVSGAWTLIRSKVPSASVDEILAAFKTTGLRGADTRSAGVVSDIPIIQVNAALDSFEWSTATSVETGVPEATTVPTVIPLPEETHTSSSTTTPIFADVLSTHWAFNYVNAIYSSDYVEACSSDPLLYCPDDYFMFSQSADLVRRAKYGSTQTSSSTSPTESGLDDVDPGFWDFAGEDDPGTDDGFEGACGQNPPVDCADRAFSRAEGSVFFMRLLRGVDFEPPRAKGIFADVDPESWYADWIEAAYEEGVILACSTDPLEFCPQVSITRDWAAYMIVQARGGLPLEQGTSFSFAIASDMRFYAGSGQFDTPSYFRGAAEAIAELGTTNFMILSGDIDHPTYAGWTIDRYIGEDYVWYPIVGNHDLNWNVMSWLRDYDYGEVNPGPSGCPHTTYSFDRANAHFVILNVYCNQVGPRSTDGDIDDHLYNWLVDDLEVTDKEHVFVFGHEPAFPQADAETGSIRHVGDSLDGYPSRRDRFWRLLDDHDVVFYGCGHTHGFNLTQVNHVWQLDAGHASGLGYTYNPSTFVVVTVYSDYVRYAVYRDDGQGGAYHIYQRGILY